MEHNSPAIPTSVETPARRSHAFSKTESLVRLEDVASARHGGDLSERELAEDVKQMDKDLNELKAQYELYFMGIEKREPIEKRSNIKSRIRRYRQRPIRNTALRFKVQQLVARMVSLENYFTRIERQREAGTYRRDSVKVARRNQTAPAQTPGPEAGAPAHTLVGGEAVESAVLKQASSSPGGSGARPATAKNANMSEAHLRKLYQTYVGAKRRCGEAVDLRFEDMASSLKKQVPALMKKTGAQSIEFKVVIRSGKAVLRALPKKDEK